MVKITPARKITILADSGWGKTTLLKSIIGELSNYFTVYIYNTDYERFPEKDNIYPLKPVFDKVADINYLSLVIERLRAKYSNFVICITDLDKFFDNTTSLNIGSSGLKDLYGTGRHQRIIPIIESKQPRYIPSKLLANTNLFYLGKFTELEDVKRLKGYATMEELTALKPHEFIEYDKWENVKRHVMVVNNEIVEV